MKQRIAGLGFLLVLAALLGLCVASYMKLFSPKVDVTVQAATAGLQMSRGADVKLHGVLVGEVRDINSTGDGAELDVALDPDSTASIPAGVTARLLPKTLFGEKYVELIAPKSDTGGSIQPNTVVKEDKSKEAVELNDVLDGALPLLRAVPPEKLSVTLSAIAGALDGRGDELGDTIVKLGDIVRTLNKEMPTIEADIDELAKVLDNYRGALPDLTKVLENLTVTNKTITDQEDELQAMWMSTQDFSDDTRVFLDRYQGRLIQFGEVTQPFIELLATYSPEYPCLFQGLTELQPDIEEAFSGGRLHITLEITQNNGKYESGRDEPEWTSQYGPNCRGLPEGNSEAAENQFGNGYDYDGERSNLPIEIPGLTDAPAQEDDEGTNAENKDDEDEDGPGVELPFDPMMGYAGTEEEQSVFTPMVAASTGSDVTDLNGDLVSLLYGPIFRGATISAR
ncbi:MCE family protein [Stackebrandtia nassauensis]|uniref:Virulence factor Mce family protein n=1 Tax=Stackebrandtia nassauensis (strain DSM 44728 / CIP 108903 / NRRL B-16338 / NBRC 102104 / LLR-40K-21) TaxID=446470 RepID=D3Q8W0_STANL|nr:MCE family protein [Stackebrandtia nassauensis]ADD40569.1 virulence factor Mce family protein [Stackebrandtia nassauensis DSM 44728]